MSVYLRIVFLTTCFVLMLTGLSLITHDFWASWMITAAISLYTQVRFEP